MNSGWWEGDFFHCCCWCGFCPLPLSWFMLYSLCPTVQFVAVDRRVSWVLSLTLPSYAGCHVFITFSRNKFSVLSSLQAANPGCCLEDFVRWYSPRDYIEEEVVDEKGNKVIRGELSARMKIPSNMWVEAWETAKPIPARRQKRLFDDTREAEKVKALGLVPVWALTLPAALPASPCSI